MKLCDKKYSGRLCWGLILLLFMSLSVNADPVTDLESRADWYALLLSFVIEFIVILSLLHSFGIRIKRLLPILILINVPTWLLLRIFMDLYISANFEIWRQQIPYSAVYPGFYEDMKEIVLIELIIALVEGLFIFLLMKCALFRTSSYKKLSLVYALGISLIGNGISAVMPAIIYPIMGVSLVEYIRTHLSEP